MDENEYSHSITPHLQRYTKTLKKNIPQMKKTKNVSASHSRQ